MIDKWGIVSVYVRSEQWFVQSYDTKIKYFVLSTVDETRKMFQQRSPFINSVCIYRSSIFQ